MRGGQGGGYVDVTIGGGYVAVNCGVGKSVGVNAKSGVGRSVAGGALSLLANGLNQNIDSVDWFTTDIPCTISTNQRHSPTCSAGISTLHSEFVSKSL